MTRYIYSLVRCVPDPRTGEFINVGAIVGRPDGVDWAVRRVSSDRRAMKLAGVESMSAVHGFLARMEEELDLQLELEDEGAENHLGEHWLTGLYQDHRNVIQLSPPTPLLADDAESGLDILFSRLIIDPVSQPRGYVTKSGVVADVKSVYKEAAIAPELVQKSVDLFVGDRLRTPVDLAVANGVAYQLTQAWSFQRAAAGVSEVATQVKAWGYAMARLKGGETGRLVSAGDHSSEVPSGVDLQVAIAPPRSAEQEKIFQEASQVFDDLGVTVREPDNLDGIGTRARELLEAA